MIFFYGGLRCGYVASYLYERYCEKYGEATARQGDPGV